MTCAITTPIYSAAFYESVQSGIVKENLGLIDLLKETWNRVTGYRYNYRTRLIPIWSLIMPTSAYFMGIHFLSFGFEKLFRKLIPSLINLFEEKVNNNASFKMKLSKINNKYVIIQRRIYETDEVEQEIVENPYMDAMAQCLSQAAAVVALYPIETVLSRLIVQGTRTIIDNTDLGYRVVPINTRYDGFFDCVQTIHETEGIFGFYKGLGNIFFETLLQYAILKIVKLITYRIYDSEWVTRCDNTNIKNLMTSSSS
jgi:solute carrier family 25 protein 46